MWAAPLLQTPNFKAPALEVQNSIEELMVATVPVPYQRLPLDSRKLQWQVCSVQSDVRHHLLCSKWYPSSAQPPPTAPEIL